MEPCNTYLSLSFTACNIARVDVVGLHMLKNLALMYYFRLTSVP